MHDQCKLGNLIMTAIPYHCSTEEKSMWTHSLDSIHRHANFARRDTIIANFSAGPETLHINRVAVSVAVVVKRSEILEEPELAGDLSRIGSRRAIAIRQEIEWTWKVDGNGEQPRVVG
jgi:hypothetical protein